MLAQAVLYTPRIYLDNEDLLTMAVGEEITLMKWGNAFVREVRAPPAITLAASAVLCMAR